MQTNLKLIRNGGKSEISTNGMKNLFTEIVVQNFSNMGKLTYR